MDRRTFASGGPSTPGRRLGLSRRQLSLGDTPKTPNAGKSCKLLAAPKRGRSSASAVRHQPSFSS